MDANLVRIVGGDAVPLHGLHLEFLLPAALVLVALPVGAEDRPARRWQWAGLGLFALGIAYPFLMPTLCIATGLYWLVVLRQHGWRSTFAGTPWLALGSTPMIYWVVLPRIDNEYALFAANNWQPLFSPLIVALGLGLGVGAVFGVPTLMRGNASQQVLGCVTLAFLIALYVPVHPFRTHLFYLSPVLVISAAVAWSGALRGIWRASWRRFMIAAIVIAAMISTPFYLVTQDVNGLIHHRLPAYMTTGDVAASQWLAKQPGTGLVLARADLSPWVAAIAQHRVMVGHTLWTHKYAAHREEVDAIFNEEADPISTLRANQVQWILIDKERGVPRWANGIAAVVTFDSAEVLSAASVIETTDAETHPASPD
jgi:hypothetical protein